MSETGWKIARWSWFIALFLFTFLMYYVTWPVESIGELFLREMSMHTVSFLIAIISISTTTKKIAVPAFFISILFLGIFFFWGLI